MDCILVAHIRDEYQHAVSYPEILRGATHPRDFKLIYDLMTFYQRHYRIFPYTTVILFGPYDINRGDFHLIIYNETIICILNMLS